MTFLEVAMRMFPYWLMGLLMIYAVYNSTHRDLLKIDKSALIKFLYFLFILTVYRFYSLYSRDSNDDMAYQIAGTMSIPIGATLTVFWEDACHGLPLAILNRYLVGKKYANLIKYSAMLLVMASFGLGHIYQGWLSAIILSLYIPLSVKLGKKYGFGTMMIAHTLYDLSTILTLHFFLG